MAWARFIAALTFVVPLSVAEPQGDLHSLIEGLSVVTLATVPENGDIEQGSGVIVDGPRGLILCTYHQVHEEVDFTNIRIITETPRKEYAAILLDYDADHDLAILKADVRLAKTAAIGDADTLSPFDEIFAVTTPKALEFNYTKGGVTQVKAPFNGNPVFMVDMSAEAGSSGGPIFDLFGKVVGIVLADMVDHPGIFISARINSAFPMLRRAGVSIPSDKPSSTEIIPSSDASVDDTAAILHWNRGLSSESFDVKVTEYGEAVKRSPDFFEAQFNFGFALNKVERYEEAVAAYEEARRLRPESPSVYRNLGLLYLNPPFSDYETAERMFANLAQYRPNESSSHNFLGESYRLQGKLEAAEDSFLLALSKDESYTKTKYNLAWVYMAMGRAEEATKYFDSYQAQYPNEEEQNRFDEAIQKLQQSH